MSGPASTADLVPPEAFRRMVALRRDLHQHPELSWKEERTAERICAALSELGIPYRNRVAGTGVVAEIAGASTRRAVALRADMDALPIQESTGLPFASCHDGVMHACGHDAHVAMLVGAASLLVAERDLRTSVRLVFQPAEELGAGAPAMIREGALDGVDMMFGGHVDARYEPGQVIVQEGSVNASADEFTIELTGPGGHAARPHESTDPILAASALVTGLHSIVARRVAPDQAAVVTVGRMAGGTAANVLASHVRLDGTIRAQTPETRVLLIASVREIAEGVGVAYRTDVRTVIRDGTPSVINAGPLAAVSRRAAARVVGDENVRPLEAANMGGEDFGFYLECVPGCFVRFGAKSSHASAGPAHSSRFDIDERVLAVGARYFFEVAMEAGLEATTGQ